MKYCSECGEVAASEGSNCLSCGGRLFDMSKSEC